MIILGNMQIWYRVGTCLSGQQRREIGAHFRPPASKDRRSTMQSTEVKVCKSVLLLCREAEGLGGRRKDRLEASEVAVKVADIRGLLDRRHKRRL